MNRSRLCRLAVFATVFLLAQGCALLQKRTPPPAPTSDWRTVAGQVRYQTPERTIVADATIRVGKTARDYSMEVSKAGVVLLKLDQAAELGWASGPLAFFAFQGPVAKAPAKLQPWYRATSAVLENPARSSFEQSGIRIEYRFQK